MRIELIWRFETGLWSDLRFGLVDPETVSNILHAHQLFFLGERAQQTA
jgi:hypothetical protein